jgi:oligopeptide transport system substrate-binding protein
MLADWVVQSYIRLERNPYHPDADSGLIDRVYFYPTEDISSEFKRYRAGELHYTREVPRQQIRWIQRNMSNHLRSGPYLGVYFLPMDTTEPPFDDVRVRKALSMTVDRKILAEKVAGAGELPAEGLVPSYVRGYPAIRYEWLDWPMEKRLTEARRLYAEAGYGPDNPLEFKFFYNTSQNNKRVTLAVAAMWKQALGVRASILNQEWKVFLQTRKFPGQWDMIRMGWIGGWEDPSVFLEVMLSGSDFNDAGFSDPEYDRMVAAANRMADPAARASALAAAEARMLEQYPVIPLFYYTTNRLVRPEVAGYRINILDRDPSVFYGIGMAP